MGALAGLTSVVVVFSTSLGPLTYLAAIVVVAAYVALLRTSAVLSGSLIGLGLTWTIAFYLLFGMSLCNGPGCGNRSEYLMYAAAAGLMFVAGIVFGLISSVRKRMTRNGG